jgi:hypothetical protein
MSFVKKSHFLEKNYKIIEKWTKPSTDDTKKLEKSKKCNKLPKYTNFNQNYSI